MQTNQVITEAPKSGFTVVLVSKTYSRGGGKRTLRFKEHFNDKKNADAFLSSLYKKTPSSVTCDYRVLGPRQLKALLDEIKGEQAARRVKGVEKRKATRAKEGVKFICCPLCKAKSKKLWSELGGLQTRRCQRGHVFEYDKWTADRAFWSCVTGNFPQIARVIG